MANTLVQLAQEWQARPQVESDILPDQGGKSSFPYRTNEPRELQGPCVTYLIRTQEVMKQIAVRGAEIKGHAVKNKNGEGIAEDVRRANTLPDDEEIPRMVIGGARPVIVRPVLPPAPVVAVQAQEPVPIPPAPVVPVVAREDVNYLPDAKFWRLTKRVATMDWDANFEFNTVIDWYSKLSDEEKDCVGKSAGRIVGFNAVETIVSPGDVLDGGDAPESEKEWERVCEMVAVQLFRGENQWYTMTGPEVAMRVFWKFMWKGEQEYVPLFTQLKSSEVTRPLYDLIWGEALIYIREKLAENNYDDDE